MVQVLGQQGAGVAGSGAAETIWDFGQHSVHEHCGPCSGKGKVNCSSCHGSGKSHCNFCHGRGVTQEYRWVVDYKGHGRNEQYEQSCYHCGRSGKVDCSGCRGRGKLQCGECSGHGYLTHIASTVVKARPRVHILTTADLSAQALSDFLGQQPARQIAQQLDFALQSHGDADARTWRVVYESQTTVVELDLALRQHRYRAAAVGAQAWAFVRPPIFDDVFIEEITDLKKIWNGKSRRFSSRRARQFFATYAGQPVLDTAMKAVAQLQGEQRERCELPVMAACQGYISGASATALGRSMQGLLNKVSPLNSPGAWWLVMVLPLAVLFIVAQSMLESKGLGGFWALIGFAFQLGLSALLVVLLLSPLAVLLSTVVSALRRRSVPAEYRQRGRNWRPLRGFIGMAWLVVALGGAYGAMAHKGWLPRWNNVPLTVLSQWVQRSGELKAMAQGWLGMEGAAAASASSSSSARAAKASPVLVRDIQKNLQRLGYKVKETGVMDEATRRAVVAFAKKHTMTDSEYDLVQIVLCQQLKQRCSNASQTQLP